MEEQSRKTGRKEEQIPAIHTSAASSLRSVNGRGEIIVAMVLVCLRVCMCVYMTMCVSTTTQRCPC